VLCRKRAIVSVIVETCIAVRIGGDVCGREKDTSDYCSAIGVAIAEGLKEYPWLCGWWDNIFGYAKTGLGILVAVSKVLTQHLTMPHGAKHTRASVPVCHRRSAPGHPHPVDEVVPPPAASRLEPFEMTLLLGVRNPGQNTIAENDGLHSRFGHRHAGGSGYGRLNRNSNSFGRFYW
jgi:hypothetical protein